MPPKPKFTREQVVDAALELVSKKGIEALTARELGTQLGSSACPIFTAFKNMEELQKEVQTAAMKRFEAFVAQAEDDMPAFKRLGMQMVRFGTEEPKLFQLLFMRENEVPRTFEDIFEQLGNMAEVSIEVIESSYNLCSRDAKTLFEHIWIYTFGLGALSATKVCHFTEEEISQMLTGAFTGFMMLVKSDGKQNRMEDKYVKD